MPVPPTSPAASFTVSAAFVEHLVWAAAEEGLDVICWRRQLEGPHQGDDRLPLAFFSGLWEALLAQTTDPLIGLKLGARFRLGRYGLVEFFLLNARTVREALVNAITYWRLVIDEEKQVRLETRADGLRLLIEPRILHAPQAYEMDLSYVMRMMTAMLGQPAAGAELGFGHALPAGAAREDYEQHYGCPVHFASPGAPPVYWLQVPTALADQPLPTGHPVIAETLATQATLQLKLLDRPQALAGRVSQLIELGAVDIERVAGQLSLSVRSLQRRLKDEGTGFGELRDAAQRRRAERLLNEPRIALKEVAYFLGYEERGLFEACQRWFGASPGHLRAQWLAQAGKA